MEAATHVRAPSRNMPPSPGCSGTRSPRKGTPAARSRCAGGRDRQCERLAGGAEARCGRPAGQSRAHGAALGDNLGAAREMENAGLAAAAAIYREKAADWHGARALWSRLGRRSRREPRGAAAYIAALVQFNLGRCAASCGDPARRGRVRSRRPPPRRGGRQVRVGGVRERAFDCFQVLVEIGRASRQFEHVLEGYINCIRILREDHLKYYALQYYDDAVAAAKQAGELSAAATIAREAAEYARSLGMAAASAHYVLEQAESWRPRRSSTEARIAAGDRGELAARGHPRVRTARPVRPRGSAVPGLSRRWISSRRARPTTNERRSATKGSATNR